MNIGSEINEDVYNLVWTNIWQECRKPIIDQMSSLAHVNAYDSLGSTIDDTLRGNICIEVLVEMGDKIPKKIRKFPKISEK
jgi:hypothetical protein